MKTFLFTALTVLFAMPSNVLAQSSSAMVSGFNTTTEAGLDISITFPIQSIKMGVESSALLCGEGMENLTQVTKKSSARSVRVDFSSDTTECQSVDSISFNKMGQWEIGLSFSNGDTATFLIPVGCENGVTCSILQTKTTNSKSMTLTFDDTQFNRNTSSAIYCANTATELTKAKLWMSSMGHGSSPTTLIPLDNNCVLIDDIEFTMRGNWDIRMEFANGDKGAFNVQVK